MRILFCRARLLLGSLGWLEKARLAAPTDCINRPSPQVPVGVTLCSARLSVKLSLREKDDTLQGSSESGPRFYQPGRGGGGCDWYSVCTSSPNTTAGANETVNSGFL